jgi:hypothetical protein
MKPTIYHNDFGTLRKAYLEIKAFVEKKVGAEVESLDTKIEEDLGCTGDDSYELIEEFVTKYNLDPSGFEFSKQL